MRYSQVSILLMAIILLPACALKTYKPEIQQGNNLDRYYVNQLKLGMTKETVLALLGSPIMVDIFHKNKWEYINYSSNIQYRLRLTFDGHKLTKMDSVKIDELSPLNSEQKALEKQRITAEVESFIKEPNTKTQTSEGKNTDSAKNLQKTQINTFDVKPESAAKEENDTHTFAATLTKSEN